MRKLKITLACNGGVSTSILCKKIIAAAEKKGFTEVECNAYSTRVLEQTAEGSNIILLGPQVAYEFETLKEKFSDIPVEVISMIDYGRMDGEKIFQNMMEKYNW